MDIPYIQTIQLLVVYLLGYLLSKRYMSKELKTKLRKHKLIIIVVLVNFLVFVSMPVRLTVPDRTQVEGEKHFTVPTKVEVEVKSHKQKQAEEMKALTKESKEKEDEIDK